MQTPLLPFLAAMTAGIYIANHLEISQSKVIITLAAVLLLLLFSHLQKMKNIVFLCLVVSFFLFGVLNVSIYLNNKIGPNHIIHYANQEKLLLEGIISENPKLSNDKTEIVVDVTRITRHDETFPADGLVILSLKNNHSFRYGNYVRFKTRLREIHNFGNPGGFDYVRNLKYRNINVRGSINNISDIVILRGNEGSFFKSELERLREFFKEQIRKNSQSPQMEIIQAIILGERKETPEDIVEAFNRTGTSHILAISGFHVGIVTFISFLIVRLLMKSSSYILLRWNLMAASAVFATFPIIAYAMIAGMGISVIRASIMAVVMMISIVLGKERGMYNTLALAALIILAVSPHALFDISFQLSFSAVWAILFISPRLTDFLPQQDLNYSFNFEHLTMRLMRYLLIFIIVTASATLGTLPLIALYFNQISTITLLANLAVVPLIGFIALPLCMAFIISAPLLPFVSEIFIYIASFTISAGISIAHFFASLPGAYLQVSTPTLLEVMLYYLLLISAVKSIDFLPEQNSDVQSGQNTRQISTRVYRIIFASLCFFFLINVIYLQFRDTFSDKLTVTAIDVGQGNASLIQFPGGKRMLIDGGGFHGTAFDTGESIVAPFLRYKRINTIDYLVLSHPHPDHLNGLLYILSRFDVKEVWTNGQNIESEAFKKFIQLIEEKKIVHQIVSSKTEPTKISNVFIEFLNPPEPVTLKEKSIRGFEDENNLSIVVRLTYGKVSFLFPSDISEPAETRLAASDNILKSQVLFVPHHGGFTSSTKKFIELVRPEIAVISCGRDNIYNMPHPDVIRRYEKLGSILLRTDKDGAISIETRGENISFSVFRRNKDL